MDSTIWRWTIIFEKITLHIDWWLKANATFDVLISIATNNIKLRPSTPTSLKRHVVRQHVAYSFCRPSHPTHQGYFWELQYRHTDSGCGVSELEASVLLRCVLQPEDVTRRMDGGGISPTTRIDQQWGRGVGAVVHLQQEEWRTDERRLNS